MQLTPLNTRIIIIFSVIPWFVASYFKARPWLHVLQLEGYKSNEYLAWLKKNWCKIFYPQALAEFSLLIGLCLAVYLQIGRPGSEKILGAAFLLLLAGWVGLQIFQIIKRPKTTAKKELVLTARVQRFMGTFKVVIGLEALLLLGLCLSSQGTDWLSAQISSSILLFSLLQLLTIFVPLNILLANQIILPVEKFINRRYFNEAKAIVKGMPNLKIIGITGSYGKTSTKFILNSIMAANFPTLMTPESYNTPMGICKVVRGELRPMHQFFIVEMGARYKGDIAEICQMTPPQMGIITAIGPQHLETFGSIEAIVATKGELFKSLPADGVAVINQDNVYCRQLAEGLTCKCLRYGLEPGDNKDVWAQDLKCSSQGTSFTLHTAKGEQVNVCTQLLGEHNVHNILAASCAALHWKMSLHVISRALARLQPVPHRLQLVGGEWGISVIDDAFNSNPAGARAALNVLKSFSGGRKFMITPGMVELGDREFELNKEFGQLAAPVCDYVILVGEKRTIPIAQGLKEAGFPAQNLLIAKDLTNARQMMLKLIQAGDVVLFENDLPDNYNES